MFQQTMYWAWQGLVIYKKMLFFRSGVKRQDLITIEINKRLSISILKSIDTNQYKLFIFYFNYINSKELY